MEAVEAAEEAEEVEEPTTTKINFRKAAAVGAAASTKFKVQHEGHGAMGVPTGLSATSILTQTQIILRLPDELSERVRKVLASPSTTEDKGGKKTRPDGGHSSSSTSATSSSSSSSSSSSAHPAGKVKHSKTSELIIDVQPQNTDVDSASGAAIPSNKYIFHFQGEKYFAMLANLPTIVETHKTFDKKVFVKVGDIGQVLIVYLTERDRDAALSKIQGKFSAPGSAATAASQGNEATSIGAVSAAVALEREREAIGAGTLGSGLTPPTQDIVKSKFELTRKTEGYPPHIIRTVLDDVRRPLMPLNLLQSPLHLQKEASKLRVGTGAADGRIGDKEDDEEDMEAERDKRVSEVVYEEVVPFEDWMVSEAEPGGVSGVLWSRDWSERDYPTGFNSGVFLEHPEILITEVDVEEDKDRDDYTRALAELRALQEKAPVGGGAEAEAVPSAVSQGVQATGAAAGTAVVGAGAATATVVVSADAVSADAVGAGAGPGVGVSAGFRISLGGKGEGGEGGAGGEGDEGEEDEREEGEGGEEEEEEDSAMNVTRRSEEEGGGEGEGQGEGEGGGEGGEDGEGGEGGERERSMMDVSTAGAEGGGGEGEGGGEEDEDEDEGDDDDDAWMKDI